MAYKDFMLIMERIMRTLVEVSVDTGVADDTSTVNYLDDASKSWPPSPGGFENLILEITEGTGIDQFAKIASNTATRITFVSAMPVAPDSTSKYRIGFFGKIASDITAWGGTALTGRDISLDLKALTDDSIKGLLKSIGDIAALENLITRIGQTTDAMVAAGAAGSVSAKLRRVTQGLEDLKTTIILAAGSAVIGKVRLVTTAGHEITDDTLDAMKAVTQTAAQAGQAPVGVNVTVASTQILAVNTSRKCAIICNDSDTTMWLAIGQTAVANQGIRLNANGGVLVISINGPIFSTEAVNAIHASSGNKVATAQELQ